VGTYGDSGTIPCAELAFSWRRGAREARGWKGEGGRREAKEEEEE
jgi:hypothetical protein